jgi:hypothetical protein
MRIPVPRRRQSRLTPLVGLAILLAACAGSEITDSSPTDTLVLTAAHVASLDSSALQIARANPGNADLKSLVDSTLMVFTAGIQAKRVTVGTNLTTAPLYLVGIHRAVTRTQGSFSTWTLVALDDPSRLTSLIEVSGFAQSAGSAAPTAVTGTIGDGSGIVNASLLQVGAGGAVTQWRATTGTASFSSNAPGAVCPGFTPTPVLSCALETMRVRFTASAPGGTGGAGSRQATLTTDADVPAMRLTYTP